ncbi:hypothetical protein G5714_004295 [Onychostoma macrolepis]|uniref:Uncharacterized protein n=1 Tax=Onychostoma macrolepis TaxID=369639 RepID=A0A7J6D4F7_9TELE|nr:hypothetical protein G5714_004295 [Onychostoma macrolepis]
MQKRKRQEKIDTFFKRNPGVCEDVARSEEDRDEEGGKGRHEAGRQEEQSEGEVREDKDDDEMGMEFLIIWPMVDAPRKSLLMFCQMQWMQQTVMTEKLVH